jgi:hypothetical protein
VAGANFSHVSFEPPQPTFGFTPIGTSVGDASEDFVAGTVTLSARGVDIWGTADQLMFANVAWSGDGQLMTQVRSLTNTSVWAKAGVMFRASTATGSAHVSVFVTPGKGVAMQYRGSTGATSVQAAQTTGVTAPLFLRLTRHGNTFTGEWSPDSFNWQTLSIITIPMPTGVLAGLAVTSHNTSATATALFADPTIR